MIEAKLENRTCAKCGKSFTTEARGPEKHCSTHCYFTDHPDQVEEALKGELRRCKICGTFILKKNYCSDPCLVQAHRLAVKASRAKLLELRPLKQCAICGKESRLKFCSDDCRSVGRSRTIKDYQASVREGKRPGPKYSGSASIDRLRMLLNECKYLLAALESGIPPQAPVTDGKGEGV